MLCFGVSQCTKNYVSCMKECKPICRQLYVSLAETEVF